VTTTTLPTCGLEPTFESIRCRLGGLRDEVAGLSLSDLFRRQVLNSLDRAANAVDQAADRFASGRVGLAKDRLREADSWLRIFVSRVRSHRGRAEIEAGTRDALLSASQAIRDDLATLRSSL
jgi:hypothetical protein